MSETRGRGAGPGEANAAAAGAEEELARCRREIERVDRELVALLAQRMELARAVGVAKQSAGLPTLDPAREASVVRRASLLAREAGLPDEEVREIFWHVIAMARRIQLDGGG